MRRERHPDDAYFIATEAKRWNLPNFALASHMMPASLSESSQSPSERETETRNSSKSTAVSLGTHSRQDTRFRYSPNHGEFSGIPGLKSALDSLASTASTAPRCIAQEVPTPVVVEPLGRTTEVNDNENDGVEDITDQVGIYRHLTWSLNVCVTFETMFVPGRGRRHCRRRPYPITSRNAHST